MHLYLLSMLSILKKDSPHTTAISDTPSFSSGTPLPLVDAIDSEEDFYGFE
jgi:hypothetical protein